MSDFVVQIDLGHKQHGLPDSDDAPFRKSLCYHRVAGDVCEMQQSALFATHDPASECAVREEPLPAPELPDIIGDPCQCSDEAGAGVANDHEKALNAFNAVYPDGVDCAAVSAESWLDSCKHRVECKLHQEDGRGPLEPMYDPCQGSW